MSFKFEEGRMYMMPVVFGPCVSPRTKPDGSRWIYGEPIQTTHYKVVCEVSAERLESILPEKYELLYPYVVVTFSALRNIGWLGGRGYDIVQIDVPVHFKGDEDDLEGTFIPVLWEDMADPILTGREQLGFSKIYGEINTMHEENGVATGSIATHGFTFLEMKVDLNAEPEDLETLKMVLCNPNNAGKFHFRYIPHTGAPFDKADACYNVLTPANWGPPADVCTTDCPPTESVFCRGEVAWHRAEWKDAPSQAHIIQFLSDMGFKRYVGAQKSVVYGHSDVYAQHEVK